MAELVVVGAVSAGATDGGSASSLAPDGAAAEADSTDCAAADPEVARCTTTSRRKAARVADGTPSWRVAAWITTTVATADAAAISAICDHVRRTERSREIMAR